MKKERCQCCNTGIDPEEIYTDYFYCGVCHKNFPYQPERSKREDLYCDCHRCFQDNLLKNHYPWLYEQEMNAREGKVLCEKIQDAVL